MDGRFLPMLLLVGILSVPTTFHLTPGVHDVAVTDVEPYKSVVARGSLALINVTVENQGDYPETFTVTVYVNTTVVGKKTYTLTERTITITTFSWNTAGFAIGNYMIKAVASKVAGETDTADNVFVDSWITLKVVYKLVLEVNKLWRRYKGITLAHWTSISASDIDKDGKTEIITGGFDGPRIRAILNIWRWNDRTLTLEKRLHFFSWTTKIRNVFVADVNNDAIDEIVTGVVHPTSSKVVVWDRSLHWTSYRWTRVGMGELGDLFAGDVDNDGDCEIVAISHRYDGSRGRVRLWIFSGSTLGLEKKFVWEYENDANLWGVYAGDVDNDGETEIVTGGHYYDGVRWRASLRIWRWDGSALTLEKEKTWHVKGSTRVKRVFVADVDDDGENEIVTVGNFQDGAVVKGQLRIWRWDGTSLTLEKGTSWRKGEKVRVWAVFVADVDKDGDNEIVTGGHYYDGTYWRPQLRIWRWDGTSLTLELGRTWKPSYDAYINSVFVADVDDDGDTEIIAGGALNDGFNVKAQLRIWRVEEAAP